MKLSPEALWRVAALTSSAVIRGCPVLASLTYAVVLADPKHYAPIAMLVVLAPLVSLVGTLGLDQALFRRLVGTAKDWDGLRGTVIWAWRWCLIVVPFGAAAGFGVSKVLGYSSSAFTIEGIAASAYGAPMLIMNAYYRSRQKPYSLVAHSAAMFGTALVVRWAFLAVPLSHAWGWVAGDIATAIAAYIWCGLWIARQPRAIAARVQEGMFAYGIPMIGNGFFQWILGSSDRIVLGALLGSGPVGLYGAVYQVAGLYNAGATEVNKSGLHRYAANRSADAIHGVMARDRRNFSLLWLIAAPFAFVGVWILHERGYGGAIPLGACLFASMLPLVLYIPIANRLSVTEGKSTLLSAASFVACIVNVVLNAGLARAIGLYAGAVANAAGFLAMSLMITALSRRRTLTATSASQVGER